MHLIFKQWVTMMPKRFKRDAIVTSQEHTLRILRADRLEAIVRGDSKPGS